MNTRLLTIATVVAGLVSAAALAQPYGNGGPPAFTEIDSNADGRISSEELDRFRGNRMAERAQQGYLLRNAGRQPAFSQFDSNGDGWIAPDELARMHSGWGRGMGAGVPGRGRGNAPGFTEVDRDGDGRIGVREYQQFHADRLAERAQQGYRLRNAGQQPAFEQTDRNGDGWLSPDELARMQAERRMRGMGMGYGPRW